MAATATQVSGRPVKCKCGCGRKVSVGRAFRPGHDARFHGRAKKVARGEMKISRATKGMTDKALTEFRSEVAKVRKVEKLPAPKRLVARKIEQKPAPAEQQEAA